MGESYTIAYPQPGPFSHELQIITHDILSEITIKHLFRLEVFLPGRGGGEGILFWSP